MKKKIVIALLLVSTLSLIGCSKSLLEKSPVEVKDTQEVIPSSITVTPTASASDSPSTETVDTEEESTTGKDSSIDSDEIFPYTIVIEGMTETINGKKHQSDLGYQMLYDSDNYTLTSEDGIDSYMAPNSDPDLYPYLYLNISRSELPEESKNKESDQGHPDFVKVTDLNDNFLGYIAYDYMKLVPEYNGNIYANDGSSSNSVDTVAVSDYTAVHYTTTSGSEWNSSVTEYFYITTDQYIYTFTANYFTEATEGFGARFRGMMNTFKIQ